MGAIKYQVISKPVRELREHSHYDVVIVGSGYGGAIAASRMARAKKKDGTRPTVCVLERGREIVPDPTLKAGYPKTLGEVQKNTQITTKQNRYGSDTGLYDLRVNDDVCVLVGCGLGGTSLINANVALEATEAVFRDERWPKCFREDPSILGQYYDLAKRWLGSTPYPKDQPNLHKLEALKASAKKMKRKFYRPPLNVTFKDGATSLGGVQQSACVLCGDCVSGCNYGAKNTTQMNYLPDAHSHGAEIFNCASVQYLRYIEGDMHPWKVHIEGREDHYHHRRHKPEKKIIQAGMVILAAGTLGSTEILLRSKKNGLQLSDQLGKNFSCNGDVGAVGYNNGWLTESDKPQNGDDSLFRNPLLSLPFQSLLPPSDDRININGVGAGGKVLPISQRPGPCIAGIIDMRETKELKDALVIEEGVLPGAFNAVMPAVSFFTDALQSNFFKYSDTTLRLQDAQQLGEVVQNDPNNLQPWSYNGPLARSQMYLLMSCDSAKGEMILDKNNRLLVNWPGAGGQKIYDHDDRVLRRANEAIRGQFFPNPLWSDSLGKRVITVHPLGGCAMADSGSYGVVNDKCQVFRSSDQEVYENLYVCDGAVIPGALAVNPLLTISAIAERACEILARDRGWTIDYDSFVGQPPVQPAKVDDLAPAVGFWESWGLGDLEKWILDWLKKWFFEDLTEDLDEILGPAVESEIAELIEHVKLLSDDNNDSPNERELDRVQKLLLNLVEQFKTGFSPGLLFKERMIGFFSSHVLPNDLTDTERIANPFEVANKYGEADGENGKMVAELTIAASNLYALINDESHEAQITGSVTCKALSGSEKKMKVKNGKFHLLTTDPDKVETWKMVYSMELIGHGNKFIFQGEKIIHYRPDSSWWTDVTTLFVTVYQGKSKTRQVVGRGILKLGLDDLIEQSLSFEMKRGKILTALKKKLNPWWLPLINWWRLSERVRQRFEWAEQKIQLIFAGKFAAFFGQIIFQAYCGLLSDLKDYPAEKDEKRIKRKLCAPEPEIYTFMTSDRVQLQLTRYNGGTSGSVVLAPGFGVRASSFATDTVSENIVEYLTKNKFDVWLFDYRASPTLTDVTPPFTIDDIAKYDWPAAIEHISTTTKSDRIQAIVHCVGSMSFLMALLNSKEMRDKIRSAICSQLTLHPVTGWQNHLKADVNLADLLRNQFRIAEIDMSSSSAMDAKKIDALLWNVWVPAGQECKNPVCHRVFSMYGPSYAHEQLNEATHTALCEMFGKVHTKSFEQLSLIVRRQRVVDCDGNETYLTGDKAKNLEKLPITFIAGGRNQIFYPETSEITLQWLGQQNLQSYKDGYYERQVFSDYAHMDLFIGKSAVNDIFPFLLGRLQKPPGDV